MSPPFISHMIGVPNFNLSIGTPMSCPGECGKFTWQQTVRESQGRCDTDSNSPPLLPLVATLRPNLPRICFINWLFKFSFLPRCWLYPSFLADCLALLLAFWGLNFRPNKFPKRVSRTQVLQKWFAGPHHHALGRVAAHAITAAWQQAAAVVFSVWYGIHWLEPGWRSMLFLNILKSK